MFVVRAVLKHSCTYTLLLISKRGSTPELREKQARLMANWGGRRAHFCFSFPFFLLLFPFSLGGWIIEKLVATLHDATGHIVALKDKYASVSANNMHVDGKKIHTKVCVHSYACPSYNFQLQTAFRWNFTESSPPQREITNTSES